MAESPENQVKAKPRKHRVVMGITIALTIFLLIIAGGWFWTAAVLFTLYQGFKELTAIFKAKKIYPSQLIVLTVGVVLILIAHFGKTQYLLPMLTLGIVSGFIRLLFRKPVASINDIGGTFLALFYVSFLPMHFILLRNLGTDLSGNPFEQPGAYYVFFTCLVIAMSDVGAYYSGKTLGKTALYPEISPKKTREGALGGLLFGTLAGSLFCLTEHFTLMHAVILSVLLIVVAQLGDLSESLMKRDAGVKDSGGIFKGHGGLLDRLDSYLFCGALSYYYIHWVVLQQGLSQEIFSLFRF